MPLKTSTFEVQEYVPISQREDPQPTIFYGTPLSKGEYDKFQDQIIGDSARGGRVRGTRAKHLEKVYRKRLTRIQNVIVDEEFKEELTNPDDIVYFMKNLEDAETGNEIDNWLLGISGLEEDERKNLPGPSDLRSSNLNARKNGTAKTAKKNE